MSVSENDSAGDLLIQEVDEDLRREQYHQLWKRYGNHAIAAALLVILIVAGYQGWRGWQAKLRQEEGARFAAAQELVVQGKGQAALDALAKIAADGQAGFALAARLRQADLLVAQGGTAGAVAVLEDVAKSSVPQIYRDLAVLKLALLTLDSDDPTKLELRVTPLTLASNAWRFSATEVLALIAQKRGDARRAGELYKQLADDLQAPSGVRSRAAEMRALLTGDSEKPKG